VCKIRYGSAWKWQEDACGRSARLLSAVNFNADAARANLSRDLGFSREDRAEHACRMGWMCDRVVEAWGTVIADFVCPGNAPASPSRFWFEKRTDLTASSRTG
jgi:adenylylsulfate kinase-like enzyme